jgi:hypothetical protein
MLGRKVPLGALLISLLAVGAAVPSWAQNTYPTSGNVGIGTTTPLDQLHIQGNDPNEGIRLTNTGTGGRQYRLITTNANSSVLAGKFAILDETFGMFRLVLDAGGNIGVGTTTPLDRFHIRGNDPNLGLRFENTGTGGRQFRFVSTNTGSSAGGGKFAILDETAGVFRLSIDGSGNIGIGTATPSSMLHVAGNVTVDGNIGAKYQDVAEWVKVAGEARPGLVLVIDPRESGRVTASAQPYDTRVVGVVSDNPGIILGEPGDGKAKIAHSGRVKVKVDATYGAIAVGDLLVSSPTPGYAMRSEPLTVGGVSMHRPGTLLGKALEALPDGQGEILVLLTLQ